MQVGRQPACGNRHAGKNSSPVQAGPERDRKLRRLRDDDGLRKPQPVARLKLGDESGSSTAIIADCFKRTCPPDGSGARGRAGAGGRSGAPPGAGLTILLGPGSLRPRRRGPFSHHVISRGFKGTCGRIASSVEAQGQAMTQLAPAALHPGACGILGRDAQTRQSSSSGPLPRAGAIAIHFI